MEMISENILSQQIGMERFKYSRLTMKQIVKISLKSIMIPLEMQEKIGVVNPKDRLMFRLRFDIGEFSCLSGLIQAKAKVAQIDLKEELELDIFDQKVLKLTLLAVRGR